MSIQGLTSVSSLFIIVESAFIGITFWSRENLWASMVKAYLMNIT